MAEKPINDRELEDALRKRTQELEIQCNQKTKELRDSQAQLIQAERMVALGNLVAGLAHEMKTPLSAVTNNNEVFELAFRKLEELMRSRTAAEGSMQQEQDRELKEMAAIIEDSIRTNRLACERLVRIVSNVRTFARLDEGEWKKAEIHDGIESTLTLLAHELKNRVTVIKEFGDIGPIECYPNQLNQVFMNILMNAAQAIEGKGEIRIQTSRMDGDVHIAISDNGRGISEENLSRLFDSGFTTKEPSLGTGLGLAISAKIIENHNGHIEVESRPGHGATFRIILPIAQTAGRKLNGER
jgi:signal transduction histidine kinase